MMVATTFDRLSTRLLWTGGIKVDLSGLIQILD